MSQGRSTGLTGTLIENTALGAEQNANQYVVIEFINPSSYVKFKDAKNKYYIRKITFHTPSYHHVEGANCAPLESTPRCVGEREPVFPITSTQGVEFVDVVRPSFTGTPVNCMEIEFMCSMDIPTGDNIVISVLCKYPTTSDDALKNSFRPINRYLANVNKTQLLLGGYRDSKYEFSCKDLFPKRKTFYEYNGTTFKTNSSGNLKDVTRIVFEDSIPIPEDFYTNIKRLTVNKDCNSKLPINQFINIIPSEHNVKYSQTDIEFITNDGVPALKKNNITTLYVILILFVLFLLIMLFFAWHEGILKKALKQIFKENLVVYQLISKYI